MPEPNSKDHSVSKAITALKKSKASKVYITDLHGRASVTEQRRYFRYLTKELISKMAKRDLLMIVIEDPKL